FPCGAARRCPGQTGPVRQSQGGDPAGAAGWGGGLYFVDPGGIKKFRRAVQRGKELPERVSAQFPCGEPGGAAPFLFLRDFVLLRFFAADSGPGGTFWQIEMLLAKKGSES
ncbi:hypothetical protein, partial [Syntrophothermus sp.]|uniref:hypothetical protein n=1 Tax=Syntrophothermus sp. TaxID=2736299 RepID=UPI00257B2152